MLIFTPFSKILFTFVVVVITKCAFASAHPQPHSGYRTDFPHRKRSIPDSPPLRRTTSCTTGWAGAVWDNSPTGGWNSVSAYLNLPHVTSTKVSALVWVGIDGTLCNDAFFQVGISATLTDGGGTKYYATAQWSTDETYQFTDFPLDFGDIVVLTATANSATSGTATIKNISKGSITVSHTFNSEYELLFGSAEWVVQPFSTEGKIEFGEVGFYNVQATKFDGTAVNGAGADLFNIEGAASVSADGEGGIAVSF